MFEERILKKRSVLDTVRTSPKHQIDTEALLRRKKQLMAELEKVNEELSCNMRRSQSEASSDFVIPKVFQTNNAKLAKTYSNALSTVQEKPRCVELWRAFLCCNKVATK